MKKIAVFLLLAVNAMMAVGQVPIDLRCEYMYVARSIDVAAPRLSWTILAPNERGVSQSAYQILVSTSEDSLNADRGNLWDSGKVMSSAMSQVEYKGAPLHSFELCYWKVRIWKQNGQLTQWSKTAAWSMGVLTPQDWGGASWIAYKDETQWRAEWKEHKDYEAKHARFDWPWYNGKDSTIFDIAASAHPQYDAAPLLRKTFEVGSINKATLYICGLGYFEAYLNGSRIGDDVLNPAWTNFDKRSFYCTYDVTSTILRGVNALGVMLGHGQYNPLCNDIWKLCKSSWVDQPKMIALLRIENADGTVTQIVSDDTWQTAPGPITYDDTRQGEIYDARQRQPGWSLPSFDASKWATASKVPCNNPLRSQTIPPVREAGKIAPVNVFQRAGNVKIYDIGQQIAGWARVKVKGPRGAKVLVEYCEEPVDSELVPGINRSRFLKLATVKDPQFASFYDANTSVRQQNGYILSGEGEETFECHFSYKGFKFIRVSADAGVAILQVDGIPVHSDLRSVGNFECSNEVINRLQRNARMTLLNNNMSIPTDCPTREKQGWTCDAYLSAPAMLYNFDMGQYYHKWVEDLAGTQNADGDLCDVAPSTAYDLGITTTWPAAICYVPIDVYEFYGDKRILANNYNVMKAFAKSSLKRQVEGKTDIIKDVLGDWLSPVMKFPANITDAVVMAPPEGLIYYGTSSHFKVVNDVARVASILKQDSDAVYYSNWAKRIASSCNKEFFDSTAAVYHGDVKTPDYREAPNAISLEFNLVPQDKRQAVMDNLLTDIKKYDYRIATGFLGTKALLNVLPDEYPEVAYKIATQPEYPGWGFMIKKGATSMWEDWAGASSLDHAPFCNISEYFYKYLAGIRMSSDTTDTPVILIKPQVVGDLTWVRASYRSMYGMITSEWRLLNGDLKMELSLPTNCNITVAVPAKNAASVTESGKKIDGSNGVTFERMEHGYAFYKVGSGDYSFISRGYKK
jgi:alpha-L-rhamnosidase